jgi:hypothetical protein
MVISTIQIFFLAGGGLGGGGGGGSHVQFLSYLAAVTITGDRAAN